MKNALRFPLLVGAFGLMFYTVVQAENQTRRESMPVENATPAKPLSADAGAKAATSDDKTKTGADLAPAGNAVQTPSGNAPEVIAQEQKQKK